ncbi:hypothetical protein MTO96_017242 [Rhipicephalus appendiculatus]
MRCARGSPAVPHHGHVATLAPRLQDGVQGPQQGRRRRMLPSRRRVRGAGYCGRTRGRTRVARLRTLQERRAPRQVHEPDRKCLPPEESRVEDLLPEEDEGVLSDLPDQVPVEEKVLEWAEGVLRSGLPEIEVSPPDSDGGSDADDECDDDEEEDGSSGFFSDELSETDVDSVLSTSDKQIQCSLGRYTLSQAQRRERTKLRLVSHSELPEWLKNNEYIVRYHRPPLYCWRACARSIFSLHTESGNIWTHLLGALGFLALGVHFFRSDVLALDWAGCLAFGIYFAGAGPVPHSFHDVPHVQLPLRESGEVLLQDGLFRHHGAHSGLLLPVALLPVPL